MAIPATTIPSAAWVMRDSRMRRQLTEQDLNLAIIKCGLANLNGGMPFGHLVTVPLPSS